MTDRSKLAAAINSLDDGRSILVLGAGFSKGARNIDGDELLLASELAKLLADELGEDPQTGLEEISGLYVDTRSRKDLLELLRAKFKCAAFSQSQKLIATAPWKRIYTTNYDDVVERCYEPTEITFATRTTSPKTVGNSLTCVHLNGYINRVTDSDFDDEIMLTDVQYFTNELRDSIWAGKLRSDFHSARNIFFVGYSLYDFDISKILFESSRPKNVYFIQHEKLSRSQNVKFSRYGELHTIGIDDFAQMIDSREQSDKSDLMMGFLSNFAELKLHPVEPERPRIENMRPFLTKGIVEVKCLNWDIVQSTSDYRIYHEQMNMVLPDIVRDGEVIFVRGDIGSGKKIFLEELCQRYLNADFRCFRFDGLSDDIADDVEFISQAVKNSRVLIAFPDYYSHERLIQLLKDSAPDACIATTSSTAAWELSKSKPFGGNEVTLLVSLDSLDELEINRWDKLLDDNALWGDHAGYSPKARKDFILKKCGSRQRDLLLFLFDQEPIKKEIRAVFDSATKDGGVSKSQLIKYLAICASNHEPSFSEVQEILGMKFARLISQGTSSWTTEFFETKAGRRNITSSIFAQYLLSEFVADREIIDELVELAVNLDHAAKSNSNFRRLKNFPLRFSFIERLFGEQGKRQKLVDYYEAVRQMGIGISNPQFWLQYAIARMSFKDYTTAEDLFNTSYAKSASKTDYDPYQIDNHYARFLIESSIHLGEYENAALKFSKVHEMLLSQMRIAKRGHYPFRVACQYLDYVERFEHDMDDKEIDSFLGCCDEILEILNNVADDLLENKYVKRCRSRIKRAIEYAEEV